MTKIDRLSVDYAQIFNTHNETLINLSDTINTTVSQESTINSLNDQIDIPGTLSIFFI
jgi:hypothetical protein